MNRRAWWCVVTGASAALACSSAPRAAGESREAGAEPADASADGAPVPYGCHATTDGAGRPPICDLAHMAFRVTDLRKARAFYGEFLGLEEPFQLSETMAVYKINDSQFIELYEEAAPPNDTNYQLRNIAFSTTDAEALRQYFASRNVAVPAQVSKNVLGNTSFVVTDPDGHAVEWVQYEPDSLTGTTVGHAMPASRVGGSVHHLGVTILDPAASDAFYEVALGFLPSSTADKEAAEAPNGAVRIEYGVTHSAPTKGFAVVRDHLCLRVDDTMAAVAALAARNPAIPIEHHVLHGFTVRANVFDPDGSRIELADSILLSNGESTGPGDVGELDSGSTDAGGD
jgi:catechol 2,3-dioxygenase-like lactoylglutathione lyase family enzyme